MHTRDLGNARTMGAGSGGGGDPDDPRGRGRGRGAVASAAVKDDRTLRPGNGRIVALEPRKTEDEVERSDVAFEQIDCLGVEVERVRAEHQLGPDDVGDGVQRAPSDVVDGYRRSKRRTAKAGTRGERG